MATPHIKQKNPTIRSVYAPTDDEYNSLKHVYDRYGQMRDYRNGNKGEIDFDSAWDKWEKAWNSYRPTKDADDWKSDIYIPITNSVIEAELSEIVEQDLRPFVVPRGPEDEGKAKVINAIITATWQQGKSDVALLDIIKDALIFGTGIGQEYFWRQPRTIKGEDGKDQKTLEYDDCYLEPVRLYDFFIDETARSFTGPNQARDCIRRYIMDYDDFREFFSGEVWDPMGNAQYVRPGGDINYYEFYSPPDRLEHDRQVEVLWYWNKPDDRLAIVANDVIVVNKPNPYKHKQLPFIRVIDVKRPYQFYGKGEAELLESLQDETNTLRRMIIDRNHLDIDKPVFVSDTLTIEDEDTIARPHGTIPVGNVNDIKFPEYSDIAGSVFKSLEMLTDDKVRVTGMDERQQSVSSSGTATEAAILKEQTIKRINMKLWHIKNDSLIDIGRLRVANIMQFYSQPKLIEIVGEEELNKAKAEGRLVTKNKKNYRAEYRQIRLKDQQFAVDEQTKTPSIQKSKGMSFFEARPEWYLPQHGGYDIQYAATETVPISKPLQQQKVDELYDRLSRNPAVDPWKLAELELKSRDQEPDDFKAQPQGQPGQPGQPSNQPVNLKDAIDLAGVENQEMSQGKQVDPTPYAPVVHTEIHISYMKSEKFKQEASDKVLKIFTRHVVGEIAAQKQRGGEAASLGLEGGAQIPGINGPGGPQTTGADIGTGMNDVTGPQVEGGADTLNVSGAQSQ